MLKNIVSKCVLFLSLLLTQEMLYAGSGLYFDVQSGGNAADILISLCLNGKGPVSCQQYRLSGGIVAIKANVPTHPQPYPVAGIKIITPGYSLNCPQTPPIPNPWPATGYCLFSAGNINSPAQEFVIQKEGHFTVGGTITGLHQSGLILQNNGTDDLPIASNATQFTFPTPISGAYNVTVLQNPVGQQCTVMNGSGIAEGDVTNVSVICSNLSYTIGGTITGLTLPGLVLQNNGGDNLSVPANATTFTFSTKVAYGAGYDVQVLTMPGGGALDCIVYNGTGTNVTANVNNIEVICNPPFAYVVSPSVPGVTKCPLNPNGSLGSCGVPINPDTTFVSPQNIVVNIERTAAYITNFQGSSSFLSTCTLDASGNLTSCQTSGQGHLVNTSDIVINSSTTNPMLYIVQNTVGIAQCSITGTTVNFPCTTYSQGNTPRGIAVNGDSTKIYITGTTPFAITSCDLDSNGLIVGSSCQQSNLSFPPLNLAVNEAGTRAYVTDPIQSKVFICSIVNGILDAASCADTGSNTGSSVYIAINSTETMAYISNNGSNTLYNCPIIVVSNVYTLGTCVPNTVTGPSGVAVTN